MRITSVNGVKPVSSIDYTTLSESSTWPSTKRSDSGWKPMTKKLPHECYEPNVDRVIGHNLTMQLLNSAKLFGRLRSQNCRGLSLLKQPDLHKRNWKKDVVYLYQFNRSPVLPNLSPFCLKIETFLRAYNLKHEVMGSWMIRSKEGRLPFIELNGEQLADSQFIVWHLKKHFRIDDGLSPEQEGQARAIDRMVEGSTYYAITYFRSIENARNLANSNVSGVPAPGFITSLLGKQIEKNARNRLSTEGIARHSREQIIEILRHDVRALDQLLGDKKFLLGIRPTLPDFTVFGHLGCAYYLPFRQPITDLLNDDFPSVRLLLERIKTHYWSDFKWGDS